ncbi:rhomboid family intramembrane serine protease [Thermaerobacter sp. PB12/4term]|uniref:rhomboid family intramembrane serine protease n=1 Tax=Thermaerobacter sp. PB12/4term TaxID=2293838 RepID=UPI000E32C897|nr:rhomboid family intramembrane serine protease [Thermaerobacter sp. PB12/4term]QIA27145.1 rhomboid family intramembrane serine protease [Thermaerobacter sp. PB12/4term]
MIPLRDTIRSRRFPWITVLLIALNVYVFYVEWTTGPTPEAGIGLLAERFGVVPARIPPLALLPQVGLEPYLSLVTAMFLHGSLVHLLGNMLFLWVFGDNVEDRLGRGRYLLFYLLAGLLGNYAHVAANPDSTIPTIGASGAVAGVLGAYFLAFPRSRIVTLIFLFIFITVAEVPAWVFLLVWFGLQVLNGLAALGAPNVTLVAWWAHVAGFVAGAAGWLLLAPRRREPRWL